MKEILLHLVASSATFHSGYPVVRTDGRVDVRSRDYQNFSDRWIDHQISLAMGLRSHARSARVELRYEEKIKTLRHFFGFA